MTQFFHLILKVVLQQIDFDKKDKDTEEVKKLRNVNVGISQNRESSIKFISQVICVS